MPELGDFLGDWRLVRRVEDANGRETGRFEGRARFAADVDGLAYVEEGRIALGAGPTIAARQRHLWRDRGGRIHVLFADGRAFHDFDPAADAAVARHDCPPDDYRVRYDFSSWPDWRVEWRVEGPAKSYRLNGRYRRA